MTANILTNLIVTFLTPMFLATTGGDLNQARAAATETVNAYTARHPADLLLIGQSIALGLAVLSSISLSMAENIPITLILRLRGNAVSLHRAADKCRQALPESALAATHTPLSDIDRESEEVLSDDRIVAILIKDGVDIARRTVAKYREAMHIPSSVQRRRDKSMQI